jgi:hypothetical protein
MNMFPSDEKNELVIQRTDLRPIDRADSRSLLERLFDALRQTFGMRPIYLIERFAEAKVAQEESKVRQSDAEANAKLLAAQADYTLKMAQARQIELAAKGKFAIDMAYAEKLQIVNELLRDVKDPLVVQLVRSAFANPDDAIQMLKEVIGRIERKGGTVEFDLPPPTEASEGDNS